MTILISLAVACTSIILMYLTDRQYHDRPRREYIKYFVIILAATFVIVTLTNNTTTAKIHGGDDAILQHVTANIKTGDPTF
jgi:hypothetical protein